MSKLITAGQRNGSNAIANGKLKSLLASTALAAVGLIIASPSAKADNWIDHQADVGTITIDTSVANTTNIKAHDAFVKVRGDSDITEDWTVNVMQPNASSKYVLFDTEGDAGFLRGRLNANGEIYIFDKQGTIFGDKSVVNVGAIITSTGYLTEQDILDNDGHFTFLDVADGTIINNGTINVADAGLAAFVAPSVVNRGVINAKLGKVAFGAGSKVTLDLYGDKLIEIAVDDKIANALIENTGAINAEGGTVAMTVNAAKEVVDNVINMSGVVNVSSVTQKGGKIVLNGGETGAVNVSGSLDATGVSGGSVDIDGQNVELAANSNVDASANSADGQAGSIIAWGDTLYSYGTLSVLGKGGFVETSNHEGGVIDNVVLLGEGAEYLIDPNNVCITSGSSCAGLPGATNITVSSIQTGLNAAGANSVYTISTAGGDPEDGDIVVRNSIATTTTNSNVTFRLDSHDDIDVNASITDTGLGLNVDLRAGVLSPSLTGHNATISGDVTTKGGHFLVSGYDITQTTGSEVNTKGGYVSYNAAHNIMLDDKIYTKGGVASFTAGGDFTLDDSTDLISTLGSDAPITILASTFDLGGFLFAGTNTITIGRSTVGTIDMGDANGSAFRIDQDEINHMFSGHLIVGNANTTNVTVDNVEMFAQFKQDEDTLPTPSEGCEHQSGGNPNCTQFFEMKDTNLTLKSTSFVDIIGEGLTMGTGWVTVDAPRLDLNSRVYGKTTLTGTPFLLGDSRLIGTEQLTLIKVLSPTALIKQAHDFADSSQWKTIDVAAGTYNENVVIYKNKIILKGANAGIDPNTGVRVAESIIDGGIGNDGTAFAVKVTGDDVTIDGFKLTADGNGVDLDGTDGSISNQIVRNNIITTQNIQDSDDEGIEGTNVNNGLIENNKLNVVGNDGMKFTGGSNITIQNNTVTGTDFKGLNLNNIAGLNVSGNAVNNTGDDGVSVANSSGVSIANNLIGTTGGTNNIHGDGISVIDSAGTAISGNQVANTTGNGIFVDPSPNTVITYNTVSNAALNGIYVVNSDNVQVGVPYGVGIVPGNQGEGGNFVSNSGLNGIEVDGGTNVMIGNNTVAGAQTNGIYVHDADGVTVSTNEVYDVAAGEGIDVRNITTSANIHYNLIHDVSGDGIFAKDVAGLHVTSNGVGYTDIFFASTKDSAGSIGGDGIEVQDSDGAYVDYNMVAYAVGNGIYNNSSDGSTIAHNTVDNVGGHGVKVNPSLGVTVSYNTITDAADDGVNVLNSDFATVIWNTINSSGNNGIEINNSDYAAVWTNTINGTDATYDSNGIFFVDSNFGSVRYNTINNVYWDGIKIWNGDGTEVVGNTVNDARLAGISLFLSDGNLLDSNILNSSGGSGIHSDTNTNTTISNNTINGTDNYYGILHMNGSNSSITGNVVNDATADGIVLWNQTGTNTVSGNTVFSAGSPGAYNGITVGWTNDAVVSGNNVDDSGWDGINVQNSNGVQVTGNTITDTFGASGVAILNSLNNYVGGNWINNSGRLGIYALNADGLGVYGNTVLNSGLEAGLAWSGIHVESTDGANVSYNYVDGADLDGINIGDNVNTADGTSSNVTVDGNVVLNVARDGIHGTAGILSASGNTVNNTGDDGIEVSNSTGVVVNYNAVGTLGGAGNIGGDGIQVNNSSYADIMGNVVMQTVGNGIFVDPSDYVEIAYNKILGVGGDGINLLDGVEGAIYSNDINGTGDSGIEAANNYGVDVYGNTVQNTGGDGIEVSNSAYAAVTGNSIYYAGDDGVDIDGSYEAAVGGNYIWDPVANGVEVSNSNGADIYGNGVYYAADGVNVAYSDYAWVNGNYIYGSGDDGVDLAYSGSSDISGNSIYYSGDNGVKVTDSNWVDVSGNYVYSTGGNGVYIDPSSYINVNGNTIYYTGDDGILVDGGYWASIYDNYIYSADGNGIRVLNNGYVNVDNNSVSYVDYDGIHVENFGYASVTDNSVYHTGDDGIETVNGDSVFIDYNTVQNAGYGDSYYYGYADYYGADGIHVRNVGSGYYGYYGDFVVEVTNNNVDTTADDGIEVVGSGRTLIGWNDVSNAGAGFDGYNDYYGWDGADGYGNDGIHVRNTYAYGGYYGEGYYGGYYSGYDVEILGNNVHVTADDGIEVVNSGSTLIRGNEVDHAGFVTNYYGYYGDYGYYGYYGYYSQIEESFGGDYYGADGIHVRNVHGESYGPGYYGYYGFQPYAVVINDNNVDTSADDGIEVVDSGRTLINWNTVNNSGVGNGYYGYYGYGEAPDGWGGDGIHVRNTYADGYLYDESYYGGYDVEVSDNEVTNSADDGIEVTYNDYYGEYDISSLDWYPGSTSTVGVLRNTVDNSGDDGIDITNANFVLVDSNAVTNSGFGDYNYDGDGITVNRHGSDGRRYKYDSFYGYGWFPNDVVITNNTVDDSADDGIEVNGYGQIEIGNNLVTDSGDDGVIVTNLLFDSWYNEVPQEEVSLFLLPVFGGANVNIHDNVVERSGSDGIEVDSFFDVFFDYFGFGPSNVNIENNDVTDSGENGLFIAGPSHGNVRVSGNTFTNFVNGAHFQSGRIDLTGDTNTFNNGSTGMLFAPYPFWYSESEGPSGYALLDIVDDTIGTTVFNGQSDFYVYLDDSAEWAPGFPTVIDGTDATYDGIHPTETGNVLTLGQYNQIEAMIHDFMDEDFRGLFFFGFVPNDIDQKDFFRTFDPFNAGGPGLNVTITGLPIVPGNLGQFLAGISPAAGGEGEQEEGGNADDLAGIEPAAGGGEDESCWSDAVDTALSGATASYTYDGTVDGLLADQAGCQHGEL